MYTTITVKNYNLNVRNTWVLSCAATAIKVWFLSRTVAITVLSSNQLAAHHVLLRLIMTCNITTTKSAFSLQ